MPELANGPGPNPGAVKRMQDRDLLHPPDAVRRDDGIGKRTRLESEGGKKLTRGRNALSPPFKDALQQTTSQQTTE